MEAVKELYNQVPFTNYDTDYSVLLKSLRKSKNELALLFKDKTAIEVGCGGGQISMCLSRYFKHVTAVDMSENSISAARQESSKRRIKNISFFVADLFDEKFISDFSDKFDYVMCYGVLHHTKDPALGYKNLLKLLKPGGIITVGLYSAIGLLNYRLQRKIVLALAGNNWQKREDIANKLFFNNRGKKVAIYDGYVHPQVSFHHINQIFGWIRKTIWNM